MGRKRCAVSVRGTLATCIERSKASGFLLSVASNPYLHPCVCVHRINNWAPSSDSSARKHKVFLTSISIIGGRWLQILRSINRKNGR